MRKILFVFGFIFLTLSACSVFYDDTKEVGPLPELTCVAVLPTGIPVAEKGSLSAAQKKSLIDGTVFFDSVMIDELGDRSEYKLLTENRLDAILGDPWGGRLQQVRDIGSATGCGAVLQTTLKRYRDRVGSEMSAETPASVAFSMSLVSVEQGVTFWSTSFDESQKALFDDIFSFTKAQKRGFKWLSAQELGRDGLKSRLQEFPYFNKEEAE
jgi:hypothetical protein